MYRMPFPGPGTAREAWVVTLSSPVYINGIRASGISVAVWRRKAFFSLCPSSQSNRLHLYEFIYVCSQKVIINWLVCYWPPPIQEWDVEGHCTLTQASVHSSKPSALMACGPQFSGKGWSTQARKEALPPWERCSPCCRRTLSGQLPWSHRGSCLQTLIYAL